MSGPRVTSGENSKQDYSTPNELMVAVIRRFGPISFDLAAHSGNKKHPRYFAPKEFIKVGSAIDLGLQLPVDFLFPKTNPEKVALPPGFRYLRKDRKDGRLVFEKRTPNNDPEAYAFDAFQHNWAELSRKFGDEHPSGRALLWDNCEWGDVDPWAERHLLEMREGANSLLLTPAVVTNWYADRIAGKADCYQLLGRLCFDGKNVFPKDCMISHFHPAATGTMHLWNWDKDEILVSWNRAPYPLTQADAAIIRFGKPPYAR